MMVSDEGWSFTVVDVQGREVRGTILDGNASGQGRTGIGVSGIHEGQPIVLTCFGSAGGETEALCRQVLGHFAAHGLPDGVAFAGTSLEIAGRTLNVPAGCRVVPGADRIRCARAELHWSNVRPGCSETEEQQRKGFCALLERVGKVSHDRVSCIVLNQEHQCDRWLLETTIQPPVIVITFAKGCSAPMWQCNLFDVSAARFPPPCDQIFGGTPRSAGTE